MEKHLEWLGLEVEDCVTKVKGVVTSVTFDLYGCIQALVNQGTDKDGKIRDSYWLDVNRLKIKNKKPVMKRPNFNDVKIADAEKGPECKPTMGI
jgi:hypothetical protein